METGGVEAQLSSLTVSSDQDKPHEEKLEIFFNFVEVRFNFVRRDCGSSCSRVSVVAYNCCVAHPNLRYLALKTTVIII